MSLVVPEGEVWAGPAGMVIAKTKDGDIGVLTGHDEIKPSEPNLVPSNMGKFAMQTIISQNFPFYSFQDVDLKNGDSEVPDELDGLIMTQPAKDISEKELRRIDQFLMKGKSLAIFAGAVNLKASDAKALVVTTPPTVRVSRNARRVAVDRTMAFLH